MTTATSLVNLPRLSGSALNSDRCYDTLVALAGPHCGTNWTSQSTEDTDARCVHGMALERERNLFATNRTFNI